MKFRTLAQLAASLINRSRFANLDGFSFGGKRDLYTVLGYPRQLFPQDYRSRFRRNAVASRIVEVKPLDTWRGGAELVENDDPRVTTDFEQAFEDLNERLKIWTVLQRADILAGLGGYAIVVLVAPGPTDEPLENCAPDDLRQLVAYAEEDAPIDTFDTDPESERFGLPVFYTIKRTANARTSQRRENFSKRVHYTRVLHVADGVLDDRVYGTPRLEKVWNLLNDLEKITGGGAEAFWKRADQGRQLKLDPTIQVTAEQIKEMEQEVEDFDHGLQRTLRTRGVDIVPFGSDVANIQGPTSALLEQICTGIGVPQRVFTGSEQGRLAADQDSIKYYRMIEARRGEFAEAQVVRPLINHLIVLGTLPEPAEYIVKWSQIKTMDEQEKAALAIKMAQVNATQGQTVISVDEIRDQALGLAPLDGEELGAAALEAALRANNVRAVERILGITLPRSSEGNPSGTRVERDAAGLITRLVKEA